MYAGEIARLIAKRNNINKQLPSQGERLKIMRKYRAISQTCLSIKTGIPQCHISIMESNKRIIGKKIAKKLGESLNIDYKYFL
jgi:transcriptional regulator with XRE-family HTH domain